MTPNRFLNGNDRCPNCFGTPKKTDKQFKKEVFDLVGSEYIILGKYETNTTKINILHNACGYGYFVRPVDFLRGNRCPKCSGLQLKTDKQFKKEVFDLVGSEYTFHGDYINSSTPIDVTHNKCGRRYMARPNDFLRKRRCPSCNISRGEQAVRDFLIKYKISFVMQKYITDSVSFMRLDFFLPEYDAAIEYDGIQHFEESTIAGREPLAVVQARDRRKNKYCKLNEIELIRIPYWELENVESILFDLFYN